MDAAEATRTADRPAHPELVEGPPTAADEATGRQGDAESPLPLGEGPSPFPLPLGEGQGEGKRTADGRPPTAGAADVEAALIETRHLTHIYESQVRALNDVNLVIRAGETVTIMGPSGSGKSTLLHMLGALDRPSAGQVLVAGRDLARVRDVDHFRACMVGFVFQFHNLIPTLKAVENVMVPMRGGPFPKERHRRRALELLSRVGLARKAERWPAQLSGGERQRVALARALANQPKLLLADEPTGNLDSQSGEEVLRLLREMNRDFGTTLIMVTHDPVVALGTGRILTLRDGRVERDERVEAIYQEEMNAMRRTRLGKLLFGAGVA
jgi:ABC-type lipoprotein export system ATPase subunit